MNGQTGSAQGFLSVVLTHFEAVFGVRGRPWIVYGSLVLFGVVFPFLVACSQTLYWEMRSRGFDLLSPGMRAMLGDRSETKQPQKSNVQDVATAEGEASKPAKTWTFFSQPASFGAALVGAYSTKVNYCIGYALWFLFGPIGKAKQKKGDAEK